MSVPGRRGGSKIPGGNAVVSQARSEIMPGFAKIPMGEKCQSRYKYVPDIPEATRTAQLWHLRYQDVFLQPSAVTVLRDRASDFAPRRHKSPSRRVQVTDDFAVSPRAPVEPALANSKRRPAGDQFPRPPQQHPDIRPGEALVCKSEGKQVSYWALSKVVSGAEQWRQLADLPPMPPPGGRERKSGRNPQGILSPAPRKGVQFEDKSPRMGARFEDTVQRGAGGGDRPVQAPWWTDEKSGAASPENKMEEAASPTATYLPQIHRAIQQRRVERLSAQHIQRMMCRRFSKSRMAKRAVVSSLARLQGITQGNANASGTVTMANSELTLS